MVNHPKHSFCGWPISNCQCILCCMLKYVQDDTSHYILINNTVGIANDIGISENVSKSHLMPIQLILIIISRPGVHKPIPFINQ